MEIIKPFTLNTDQASYLQTELSGITPKQLLQVQQHAKQVKSVMEGLFDKYIPQKTTKRVATIEKRIVVITEPNCGEISSCYNPNNENPPEATGFHSNWGDVIFIESPTKKIGIFKGPAFEQYKTKNNVDEKIAQKDWALTRFYQILNHELSHTYQSHNIHHFLAEAGAYYYERLICEVLNENWLGDTYRNNHYDRYANALNTHGDIIHRMFFGAIERSEKTDAAWQQMTSGLDLQKPFPLKVD